MKKTDGARGAVIDLPFSAAHLPEPAALAALREEHERTGRPATEVVRLTPEVAAWLLELNEGNRPVRQEGVDLLADDMRAGRWELNGETIILARGWLVNDGQHRLWAVVQSSATVESLVTYGLDRRSRLTVDLGRARTTSNILALSGVANYSSAAACAGHLLRWDTRSTTRSMSAASRDSKPTIARYYHAHEAEIAGVVARCVSGAGLPGGSPLLYLRDRLARDKRMPIGQRLELVLRAWNVWREGRSVASLPVTGQLPEIS